MKGFEWDENKRERNLQKHGLDFLDAIHIFMDPERIEVEVIMQEEKRYQTIGSVNEIIIFVVYTHRGKNKRLISARKASKNERKIYQAK